MSLRVAIQEARIVETRKLEAKFSSEKYASLKASLREEITRYIIGDKKGLPYFHVFSSKDEATLSGEILDYEGISYTLLNESYASRWIIMIKDKHLV